MTGRSTETGFSATLNFVLALISAVIYELCIGCETCEVVTSMYLSSY